MNLNWVDYVILGTLAFFALEALGRPFFWELIDLLSFIISGLIAFTFYNVPGRFFENEFKVPHGLSLVLGFMSAWFLSEVAFYLIIRIILPKLPNLALKGSRFLSVFPALLRGLIFTAVILVMVATFPIQPALKKAVLDSKIGSQILKRAYALDQPVKQVFGGIANDSLTFLTIKPKTDEKINLGFQTNDISEDRTSEETMFNLVNKERVKMGLKALVLDEGLAAIAKDHSADMLRRGYFSHYSPEGLTVADRVLNAGIDFIVVGENLAYAPSVDLAHQGLMNSPGHRANILSTGYSKLGIGVMDSGVYGKMFTQVFTN